jgi:RNA polymerase sigma-70 factor (ECF subfamily)
MKLPNIYKSQKKTVEGHITRAFKILNQKLGKKIKSILIILFDFKLTNSFK